MNYRKDFEKCMEYIEINLKNEISIKNLADYLGYSLFHFCRVFHLYKDMSPMEYILRRRLQLSILDIKKGKKIIDIAMEYHFETSSGYSKAFKKYFHNTPSHFRRENYKVSEFLSSKEQLKEPVRIEIRAIDSFTICGINMNMDYESTVFSWNMAAFWEKYDEENIEERLYADINPLKHGEVGVCIKQDNNNSRVNYLLGVIAPAVDTKHDWTYYNISGGKYAIFTTPPVDMQEDDKVLAITVRNVWRYCGLHPVGIYMMKQD